MKNKLLIPSLLLILILSNSTYAQVMRIVPKKKQVKVENAAGQDTTTTQINQTVDNQIIPNQAGVANFVKKDTTIQVDTTFVDGFNAKKYRGPRPSMNSVLKSDAMIKDSVLKLAKLTHETQVSLKDTAKTKLTKKVLPVASASNNGPAEKLILSMPELREDDAVYNEYVWREIDARQKLNRSFIHKGYNQQGDQRFAAILLKILKNEKKDGLPAVTPFIPEGGDDFIEPMSMDIIDSLLTPKIVIETGSNAFGPYKRINKVSAISPESIYTFLVKEQYIFDKKYGQLFRRIIGIAPVSNVAQKPQKVKDRKGQDSIIYPPTMRSVLFWVNYEEIRPYLSKYMVYNPKNEATSMSWSDLLDLGYFDATIYKTTIDNENDKDFRDLFQKAKDPMKTRLEFAEKMRQKIFDQEQDRWVY
jgi:gliding motility associated protien GldN